MSVVTLLAIYAVSWWTTLFAILPLGVRSQLESGEITPGTEPGAPSAPRVWRAVWITTLVAFPVSGLLYVFVTTTF